MKESLCWIADGDWEYRLATFLMGQRTTQSSTTGCSPEEMLMAWHIMIHLKWLHPGQVADQKRPIKDRDVLQGFFLGDPVYAQNYTSSLAWLQA